jgi:DNA primase
VALVRNFVDLKPAGKTWKGLCPFHSEKTPSFHVDPVKNLYYCFGCSKGGGPVTFLMEITGQSFVESLKELADRANYTLPTLSQGQKETGPNKAALYEVMKLTQEFYFSYLANSEKSLAYQYLRDRGISKDSINAFGLGLAPNDWDRLHHYLESIKFSKSVMAEAGLIKKARNSDKFYDTFRNRITFPVFDTHPRVVALAARTFDPKDNNDVAKYINSPTTPIYEKGRQLYGFNLARPYIKSGGVAFLVEGYFDVISLVAKGVKPVVAAMGTALTQHQVNILKGSAKEVHLVFDGDSAGMAAAKRALPLLYNADLDGRVICLPPGHDPDSFVREFGGKVFYELADKAQDLSEFYVSRLSATNAKTITGQGRIITDMQEILQQIPDKVKGQFLRNKLAERLGLSPELLQLRPVKPMPKAPVVNRKQPSADYNTVAGKLLRFVIIHTECLPLLKDDLLDIWPEDRSKDLLEQILKQIKETPGITKIRTESLRLEDDRQLSSLVSEASMSPREYHASQTLKMAENFITKLSSLAGQKINEEFTRAIAQAEAAGDDEAVMKLLAAKVR